MVWEDTVRLCLQKISLSSSRHGSYNIQYAGYLLTLPVSLLEHHLLQSIAYGFEDVHSPAVYSHLPKGPHSYSLLGRHGSSNSLLSPHVLLSSLFLHTGGSILGSLNTGPLSKSYCNLVLPCRSQHSNRPNGYPAPNTRTV
jgi:hypothetical protein